MRAMLLRLFAWLYTKCLPKTSVDLVNSKLIEPVPGLVIDGKQYFRYVNPDDMPTFRYIHFLSLREEVSMGIDKPLLKEYIKDTCLANNANDRSKVGALMMLLEDTVDNLTPIESFYWMAALDCFDPAMENTAEFDHDLNKRKVAEFKKLKNPGFFLQTLSRHMSKAGGDSAKDTDRYLKEVKVKLAAYEKLRGEWRSAKE